MNEFAKRTFLDNQVFSMTLMATVQRGHVYRDGASEEQKAAFQQDLRSRLQAIAANYNVSISDAVHESNIVALADSLSVAHGPVLNNGRFRIGSAQKALNLFLKYRWCMGECPEPPHCPFDFRIITKFPRAAQCNWTQLDSIDGYRTLVAAARTAAAGQSLASWELAAYNAA